MKNETKLERISGREFVATCTISGSLEAVFEAWANPELFKKWWVPKSAPVKLESSEMEIRTGGKYRLRFRMGAQTMEFFGKYLEVTAPSRLVWTNEEGGETAAVITTVTLEDKNGGTQVTVHDLYPSEGVLDEAMSSGSTGGLPEQLAQLDELIVEQGRQ